jgi:hypothetical protein
MSYQINDKNLIAEITGDIKSTVNRRKNHAEYKGLVFSHPLDKDIVGSKGKLKKLISGNVMEIDYSKAPELDSLWKDLIQKSIECLRFFDSREPFLHLPANGHTKYPVAYGLDTLTNYQDRYTKFESMLYGASYFYRDHVFHAIRTWMLGIFCLVKKLNYTKDESIIENENIVIDGEGNSKFSGAINFFEKISMWTIIALCHDLGYPLEKSEQILDNTQAMMKVFVPRPNIWNNFGFNGTQDTINEYIIKFISTKMIPPQKTEPKIDRVGSQKDVSSQKSGLAESSKDEMHYFGRIQPKYYLKFAKSLEGFNHGIVSSVIIYKMLLYFLESDFNLNDDYTYTKEDARQFYIRREILRAMASHTCADVYNIYLTSFSSLLFLCDEMQEWGRKTWNDMYTGRDSRVIDLKINEFSPSKLDLEENIDIDVKDVDSQSLLASSESLIVNYVQRIFERQYSHYKTKFRDGQYTKDRDLCILKKLVLKLPSDGAAENQLNINYVLSKEESKFEVDFSKAPKYARKDIKDIVNKIESKITDLLYYDDFKVIGL